MLDIAVAYNRYRFLGKEFLTWLWYILDNRKDQLAALDKDLSALEIGNRIVLENHHEGALETVTIKGNDAGLEEGLVALKKGALVSEINLVYQSGEHRWQFNLKGESLNLSSLKTPETRLPETTEDLEGAVLEKIYLYEKVTRFLESAFVGFIRIRLSEHWEKETVPGLKKWIAELA